MIFKEDLVGAWTDKSDHRRRTCVVTGLNRDQVVEKLPGYEPTT